MRLKQKSEFNIDAAELLIKSSLYAPSVHCSYYSCLQLFKFVISHNIGVNYIQQATAANKSNGSSHVYISKLISSKIEDRHEKKTFERKVMDLKNLRKASDYNDEVIDVLKASKAQSLAQEIIQKTKQKFRIL